MKRPEMALGRKIKPYVDWLEAENKRLKSRLKAAIRGGEPDEDFTTPSGRKVARPIRKVKKDAKPEKDAPPRDKPSDKPVEKPSDKPKDEAPEDDGGSFIS
jgi:hypothetical protein